MRRRIVREWARPMIDLESLSDRIAGQRRALEIVADLGMRPLFLCRIRHAGNLRRTGPATGISRRQLKKIASMIVFQAIARRRFSIRIVDSRKRRAAIESESALATGARAIFLLTRD